LSVRPSVGSLPRNAERLTIYLEQTEHHGDVSEYVEIVERARRDGLAGATVVQGVEGFGGAASVHRRHALAVKDDAPVVITVVDTAEKIGAFLYEVERLLPHGLVVRQSVEVVIHRRGGQASGPSTP
jgi:PII-like signaling protein